MPLNGGHSYYDPRRGARYTVGGHKFTVLDVGKAVGATTAEPNTMERENTGMTTNYDVPGAAVQSAGPNQPDHQPTPRAQQMPVVDAEELAAADSFELPGADTSSEEISVELLPAQVDEFTCASCFLVRHRSQIALDRGGILYCSDCEG